MNLMRNETRTEVATDLRLIRGRLKSAARDEAGVTSIEYALLGTLIALAIVTGVGLVGIEVKALWTTISNIW